MRQDCFPSTLPGQATTADFSTTCCRFPIPRRAWHVSWITSTRCKKSSAGKCCWKTPLPTWPSRKAPTPRSTSLRPPCSGRDGLLLDVNNVYVASINQQWDPFAYIDGYPLAAVQEIHLAGHAKEADEKNRPLLIDTHDRQVADIVWDLFARVVHRSGPLPTLIEWDANIPGWQTLKAEAERADAIIQAAAQPASVEHVTRRAQFTSTQHPLTEAQTS